MFFGKGIKLYQGVATHSLKTMDLNDYDWIQYLK